MNLLHKRPDHHGVVQLKRVDEVVEGAEHCRRLSDEELMPRERITNLDCFAEFVSTQYLNTVLDLAVSGTILSAIRNDFKLSFAT